jgi:alpha/beta superfamily hydrolase
MIDGPCGVLEAILDCPPQELLASEARFSKSVAVIAHPHPLHGGTMQNKVVHYLARTVNQMGIPALRFNFRGVGQSEGEYAEGVGEVDDLVAAAGWMQEQFPGHALWLAGFSFGAYVALQAAARLQPAQLITVAPPVNIFDLSELSLPSMPWVLVQGGEDEIVPSKEVLQWVSQLPVPPQLLYLEQAGHFFHGRLNELREGLLQHFIQGH